MNNRILRILGLFISVNLTIGLAFVSAQVLTVGEHPVELRLAAVSNNMAPAFRFLLNWHQWLGNVRKEFTYEGKAIELKF
ncbi:MAG TPA: hypothetical protein ENI20_10810 [Bacteroides sp.]|nr:hypothetical protein [Bacteroides sp.]